MLERSKPAGSVTARSTRDRARPVSAATRQTAPRVVGLACALALGGVALRAQLPLDLSYVDTGSNAYARFASWVDDSLASPDYGFSATDAVYMYEITGQTRYATTAIAMVDQQVSDAETAIGAGDAPEIAGDSYLESGPLLRDLSLVDSWCHDLLTQDQIDRWSAYAEQTVWNIWNFDQAEWGGQAHPWSGWSTDNPGDNYYYSFLEATMYWALASESSTWIDFLNNDKLPPLVSYFQSLPGGGSREGTAYGTSHMRLFGLYRLWRDAGQGDLGAQSTHLADSIDYWIHATVPTLDRFAPIGDQARVSEPVLYDYQRRLVLEARNVVDDTDAAARASWWLHHISVAEMASGFNLRYDLLPAGVTEQAPTALYYHATGVGQLFARASWNRDALWLAFVAGPYTESHAHQEQGGFTLYRDGWLAVTENIFTHSGIQQGTEVHDVVRFVKGGNDIPQVEGTTSTMTVTPGSGGALHVEADLGPAFGASPDVSSWQRVLDFTPGGLEVTDSYSVASGVAAIWQIDTPVEPVVDGKTAVAGDLRVTVLEPADATLSVLDWRTVDAGEFLSGYRLEIHGSSADTGFHVQLAVRELLFRDGFESGDIGSWSAAAP